MGICMFSVRMDKRSCRRSDLGVTDVRSPLTGPKAGEEFNWYSNYGDFQGSNANDQDLKPPLRMRWARRLEGTVKHLPVCGGGRMYLHTAEGQVMAVEQDTGRLLWRRHWPHVYLSFTSPLYYKEKLLIPQGGIRQSRVRCLDAKNGKLLWEAPFTGSPGWSRQFPPVVHGNVAIYASGSGEYARSGFREGVRLQGRTRTSRGRSRSHELDLCKCDSLFSERPQAAGLGMGSRHRQSCLAQGLFKVRKRRQ